MRRSRKPLLYFYDSQRSSHPQAQAPVHHERRQDALVVREEEGEEDEERHDGGGGDGGMDGRAGEDDEATVHVERLRTWRIF